MLNGDGMDTETQNANKNVEIDEATIRASLVEGKAVYEVMDLPGDLKSIWDPNDAVLVEIKRREFEELTKPDKNGKIRYKAYRVSDDGTTGEQMPTFEAARGRVIFLPALVGG